MLLALSELIADHSVATVVAALLICLTSGWLIAALMERAQLTVGRLKPVWLAGAAAVAGLGVWTTHFLAMIGYRPDLPLTYGLSETLISVVIGILGVGVPLALTGYLGCGKKRAILGAASGSGIGFMHFTGMAALSGCLQAYNPIAVIIAFLLGMAFMAMCASAKTLQKKPHLWALLFSLAVGSVHFISIAGTTLTPDPSVFVGSSDKHMLSILIGLGAAALLIGTIFVLVTAKRFDAQELAHSTILATALQNMSNGLVFINANGKLGLFNQRFVDLFQIESGKLETGMSSEAFFHFLSEQANWDDHRLETALRTFQARLSGEKVPPVDHVIPGGRIVSIDSNPVLGGGVVFTFDDVTEERAARDAIAKLAYNDPLTGLPNRRSFWRHQNKLFDLGRDFSLLLVDLDRFKAVNDTFGHSIGDALLIEVGKRIRCVIGAENFLARLGGDELAVLIAGPLDGSMTAAEEIIASISKPYVLGPVTASVGCSVGVCSAHEVANPDELMQCADVALYEAKRIGRANVVSYRPGLLEAVAQRHKLESDLRIALANDEFHLAYQPVLSLQSDEISGYEALLRWSHPERGNVSPVAFIPLAEETGLIIDIGRWVLEAACTEAASWDNNRHIAVNVSPIQFRAPDFFHVVHAALQKSGLAPQRLELELTETALVEDGERIAAVLHELREIGVKVAMDDFGTGYSSLAHLCDFPLDRIKIDRSFVAAAATDTHAHAIIKAVVALGRDIGVPTLAEGVETPEQLALLRDMGCEAVQGFLIGKPASVDEKALADVAEA